MPFAAMLPRVLTIAGSDSGGGAGVQADLKVMTAHSVYGLSVITAITSQNTVGVDAVKILDVDIVEKQFRAVTDDIGCDVFKLGMLGNEEIVRKLASLLVEYDATMTVVDPVMVATSGATLLDKEAIDSFLSDLLPLTYILTPNIPEAKLLLAQYATRSGSGLEITSMIESLADMKHAAKELSKLGPKFVLLKGGHLPLNPTGSSRSDPAGPATVFDILCENGEITCFQSDWSSTKNTHGTGCTLASAIACNLALGSSPRDAVAKALDYVRGAIAASLDLGQGSGPLNHMYRLGSLPFSPGHFVEFLITSKQVQTQWKSFTEHKFVQQLAEGSLPLSAFKHFLVQDFLYLKHYARLHALAAYKSDDIDRIADSAEIILHIKRELNLHLTYCESFGISRAQLDSSEESIACTVYTRYMESIGTTKDWISLQVALFSCLIGYGHIGRCLHDDPRTNHESLYWTWIQNYAADDYSAAVVKGRALVEAHAPLQSPSKIVELVEIFRKVTEYEALFWSSALDSVT